MRYKKSEIAEFRKVSVRTYQTGKDGRKHNEGSGVLYHYRGITYLLTAGHCARNYDDIGLEVELKLGQQNFIPVNINYKIKVEEDDKFEKDYALFVVDTPDTGYFEDGKVELCDIEDSKYQDDDYATFAFPFITKFEGRDYEIVSNEDDFWEWKDVYYERSLNFHEAIEGGSGAGALNLHDGVIQCAGIFKCTRDEDGSCHDVQVTPAHVFQNEIAIYSLGDIGGDANGVGVKDVNEDYIPRHCSTSKTSTLTYLLNDQSEKYTLLDYVKNVVPGVESFRYILFGQPQSGKSFELQHTAHILTESEEFDDLSVWYITIKDTPVITSDNFPAEEDFRSGCRPVVFVDGLDESSVRDIDDNINTIRTFALSHPTAGVVISCRETYKFEKRLDIFKPLYFDELTSDDVEAYISKFECADKIRDYIVGQDVYELCKTPIGLKGIVEFIRKRAIHKVEIPKNQVQLYESLVQNRRICMRESNKEQFETYFKKTDEALSKIAVVMLMTDKQALSSEELDEALASDKTLVTYCSYYYHNLFHKDECGQWIFDNHAFKEYYAAIYLCSLNLVQVQKLVSTVGGQIKEQWYNVLLLWLQKKGVEGRMDKESVDWIVECADRLLVRCDPTTLNDEVRFAVFASILNKLSKSNARYDVLSLHSYKHLFEFAKDNNLTIEQYIANQLHLNIKPSAHLYNVMALSAFIDWDMLQKYHYEIYRDMVSCLFGYIEELGDSEDSFACFFFFSLSKHFYKNEEYVEKLYAIIKAYRSKATINAFCMICAKGGWADKYLGFLMNVEKMMSESYNHIDSKEELYAALASVLESENVKSLLMNEADLYKARHEHDSKLYIKLIGCPVLRS